jgi:hypothetical protein
MRSSVMIVVLLLVPACASDDAAAVDAAGFDQVDPGPDATPSPGQEGDACAAEEGCVEELVCRTGFCLQPGQEGDGCEEPSDCAGGFDCLDDGACHAVGGVGQPCDGDACDPGLMCVDGTCVTTIEARFCHCLTNSFGDTLYFKLTVGPVEFPYIPTMSCAPCTPIPTGNQVVTLHRQDDADPPDAIDFFIDPTWPDVAIFAVPGPGIEVFQYTCEEQAYCP